MKLALPLGLALALVSSAAPEPTSRDSSGSGRDLLRRARSSRLVERSIRSIWGFIARVAAATVGAAAEILGVAP
jgi:hypothetical protein